MSKRTVSYKCEPCNQTFPYPSKYRQHIAGRSHKLFVESLAIHTTVGTIFCNSPCRKPSSVEISAGIKENCGQKKDEGYNLFATMPATKFVEKCLPVLKAPIDDVRNYRLHVALLRKYCGMDPSARTNHSNRGLRQNSPFYGDEE
ncbi:hypothetical protein EMCRGX_G002199 [Ephydatia muelleri]